jgi:hypothetical protein
MAAKPPQEHSQAAQKRLRALMSALPADCTLHGVIDVNRDQTLYDALQAEAKTSQVLCLYDGQAEIRYGRYAPYLITPHRASPVLQRWLNEGWEMRWGIFLASNASVDKLKRHLKRFITALDSNGKKTWLRFYDPDVLPDLLQGFNPGHLYEWFGGGLIGACLAPEANGLWRATPQSNLLDKLTQVVQLQTRQFKIEQSC